MWLFIVDAFSGFCLLLCIRVCVFFPWVWRWLLSSISLSSFTLSLCVTLLNYMQIHHLTKHRRFFSLVSLWLLFVVAIFRFPISFQHQPLSLFSGVVFISVPISLRIAVDLFTYSFFFHSYVIYDFNSGLFFNFHTTSSVLIFIAFSKSIRHAYLFIYIINLKSYMCERVCFNLSKRKKHEIEFEYRCCCHTHIHRLCA